MNLTKPNNTQPFLVHSNVSRDYFDSNGEIRIPLYGIIFLISVIGNLLVILTLVHNARMRSLTNVFLLNLAISDLLLAVFCMPFTLVPLLQRNFIFGEVMCVAIRYLQAVSVCVSCFTLVAISLERYFAICEPLQSRKWQTLSHAYRTIIAIWICALFIMIPIAVGNEVITLQTGSKACREIWAKSLRPLQIIYSIFLAMVLFVFPLIIMVVAYGAISYKLWFNMKQQMKTETTESLVDSPNNRDTSIKKRNANGVANVSLRQTNIHVTNANRKRVIKMLFVVVLEYFVCCSPLYIVNTWKVLHYMSMHNKLSDAAWSLILLLNYLSSCIHPITYCFMNKNFRKSFLGLFHCFLGKTNSFRTSYTEMSVMNYSSTQSRMNRLQKGLSKDSSLS